MLPRLTLQQITKSYGMFNSFSIYCNVMEDKTTGETYNDFPSLKSMIFNSAYTDPYLF